MKRRYFDTNGEFCLELYCTNKDLAIPFEEIKNKYQNLNISKEIKKEEFEELTKIYVGIDLKRGN